MTAVGTLSLQAALHAGRSAAPTVSEQHHETVPGVLTPSCSAFPEITQGFGSCGLSICKKLRLTQYRTAAVNKEFSRLQCDVYRTSTPCRGLSFVTTCSTRSRCCAFGIARRLLVPFYSWSAAYVFCTFSLRLASALQLRMMLQAAAPAAAAAVLGNKVCCWGLLSTRL